MRLSTSRKLNLFVEQGYSIVGCEPSCILTFRDEYPDLLKGHAVQAVAKASYPSGGVYRPRESREPLEAGVQETERQRR